MAFLSNSRNKLAWLHLASILLTTFTFPLALSAPNRIPQTSTEPSTTTDYPEVTIYSNDTTGEGRNAADVDSSNGGVSQSSSSSSSSSIETMFSHGETQTNTENHNTSAIFLMGNKGSGQAALAQTIIANYQMQSSGEVDTSSYAPQYMVNQDNSMAFYNFPEFDSDRTADKETASAYFTEKITKHVTQVKFMFTATHSSVQHTSGSAGSSDYAEFDLLITNAAKLVTPNQAGKFTNSIGLVITNVNEQETSDQAILTGAETFFTSYKQQLNLQVSAPGLGQDERVLIQRKISFVDALLRRAVSGGMSLNSVWFLRGSSGSGNPGNGGTSTANPISSEGTHGPTPTISTGGTPTIPASSSGSSQGTSPTPRPSQGSSHVTLLPTHGPTATPRPSEGPTGTPRPSEGPTGTPRPSEGPTGTPRPSQGTTTGTPGNSGGNPGKPYVPDEETRRNIADLYMNRLQFSASSHVDFSISLTAQTISTIKGTFLPQISAAMQTYTTSAVQTTVNSYYINFVQTAFVSQNTDLHAALESLNLDVNNIVQSGLVSITGLIPIFTHPLEPSPNVFHLEVITQLSQFLRVSFPTSYLSSMGSMTNWIAFFQQVSHTTQSGTTITETAVLNTFNLIHSFRDRVSREICNTNCGSNGNPGSGGLPFHLR